MKEETKKTAVKKSEIMLVRRLGDVIEHQNYLLKIIIAIGAMLIFYILYVMMWLYRHNYLTRILGSL